MENLLQKPPVGLILRRDSVGCVHSHLKEVALALGNDNDLRQHGIGDKTFVVRTFVQPP